MMGGSDTVSGDKDGVHTTAIHVPIGWQRRVEGGQVLYVRYVGSTHMNLLIFNSWATGFESTPLNNCYIMYSWKMTVLVCKHILGDVTWQDDCGFGLVFWSLFLAIDNKEDKKMFYALLGSAKWVKLNVLIIMFYLFWWALILVLFILILVVLNTHLFKHTRS